MHHLAYKLGILLQGDVSLATIKIYSRVVFKMYSEWSTVWLEQPIIVKAWFHNHFDTYFQVKEELWIGGQLVDRNNIRTWQPPQLIHERLAAPVTIADRVYQVEVLGFSPDSKNYCNISINCEIIGGDIDFEVPRTDLGTWPEIRRRRGFRHPLVEISYSSMLRLLHKLAVTIFMFPAMSVALSLTKATPLIITWEYFYLPLLQWAVIVTLGSLFGGILNGFLQWQTWEQLYAQTLLHQRKLNASPICLEMVS